MSQRGETVHVGTAREDAQPSPQRAKTLGRPNWDIDENATKFAHELLAAEKIQTEAGVDIYELTKGLQVDDRKSPHLFVRHSAEEVWQRVAQETVEKDLGGVLVTGSPGIGKSRGLTYLLKLLLKDKQTVIFECKKGERVFLFTLGEDGKYTVQSKRTISGVWIEDIDSFISDENNWYLIDPAEQSRGTTCPGARVILAASPNRNHYHEFVKEHSVRTHYMNPWSLDELKAVRCHVNVTADSQPLTPEEMAIRFKVFGGIPRHIFWPSDTDKLRTLVKRLVAAAVTLSWDTVEKARSNNATIEQGDDLESALPSILFSLNVNEKGDTFNLYVSDFVKDLVVQMFYVEFSKSPRNTPEISKGVIFEKIALHILACGGTFKAKLLQEKSNGTEREEQVVLAPAEQLLEARDREETFQMLEGLQGAQGRSLVTASTNFPCVDAFDSATRVYQITLNSDHQLNAGQWKTFLDACAKRCDKEIIDLYVLVPGRIYRKGMTRMSLVGNGAKRDAAKLRRRYREWMLSLDDDLFKQNAVEVILSKIQL